MNQFDKVVLTILVFLTIWEFVIPLPLLKIAVVLFLPLLISKYPFGYRHAMIIFICLIVWYIYGWISFGWSIADATRVASYKANYFISFSFIICIIAAVSTNKAFFYVLKLLYINGLIILPFAFAEFALHRYFFYQDTGIFYADAGWFVPLVNQKGPNEFVSELLALFIFGLIYLKNKGAKSIVEYLFILVYGITIFLTDSRSGLLAFLMVSGMYFMLSQKYKAVKLLLVVGLVLGVAYVVVHLAVAGAAIEEEPRWVIWVSYIDKFINSNYRGIGWGSIGSDNYGPVYNMSEGSIHNYFLEVLVEVGFIGMICFLYLFLYVLLKSYSLYKKTHKRDTNLLYIFLFAIGFAITSIGPSSMRQLNDMWLFLALAISYCIISDKNIQRSNQHESIKIQTK